MREKEGEIRRERERKRLNLSLIERERGREIRRERKRELTLHVSQVTEGHDEVGELAAFQRRSVPASTETHF